MTIYLDNSEEDGNSYCAAMTVSSRPGREGGNGESAGGTASMSEIRLRVVHSISSNNIATSICDEAAVVGGGGVDVTVGLYRECDKLSDI